jgi:flagellar biosynthetic protein FlhB
LAEESYQEKTERATPKRREDARKRGQVARSMELNSVAILFFGLVSLTFLSSWILQQIVGGFTENFALIPDLDLTPSTAHEIFKENGFRVLRTVFPMMVVIAIAGILINFAQVGALFTLEPITPKAERFDLTKGAKRIFSRKTAVELFRDILKVAIIGAVAFLTIRTEFPNIFLLADQSPGQVLLFCATTTLKLGLRIALALLFLAVLDFAFQRFEQEKNLRMTRQEVKEELKEYEGDPLIKARVKRIQRELSRKRMLKEVEKADVVVTNPTQIAVALRYDMQKDEAPLVVAKGERLIAEKIKEIARKFEIPIVENKPLARSLFELAEVGMQIPARLYRAVAEVLAYVYKQKGKV